MVVGLYGSYMRPYLSEETQYKLHELKEPGESTEDIVVKLIDQYDPPEPSFLDEASEWAERRSAERDYYRRRGVAKPSHVSERDAKKRAEAFEDAREAVRNTDDGRLVELARGEVEPRKEFVHDAGGIETAMELVEWEVERRRAAREEEASGNAGSAPLLQSLRARFLGR